MYATDVLRVRISPRKGQRAFGGIFKRPWGILLWCAADKARVGKTRMHGILVTCIAIMALFLGLFAISVPAPDDQMAPGVSKTTQVQTAETDAASGK
jgi:hypothetical protein